MTLEGRFVNDLQRRWSSGININAGIQFCSRPKWTLNAFKEMIGQTKKNNIFFFKFCLYFHHRDSLITHRLARLDVDKHEIALIVQRKLIGLQNLLTISLHAVAQRLKYGSDAVQ